MIKFSLMPFLSLIRSLGLIICLVISVDSFSQRKKSSILKYDTTFYNGGVVLTDGFEMNGRLAFNDKDGIVTLVNENDSRSFNSRGLLQFGFYSHELERDRLFYSLEYQDPLTGIKDIVFFEVLGEFDSFAVLSKIDRLKTEARKGPLDPVSSPLMVDRKSKKFIHEEVIFFVNDQGDFEPYLRIFEKEIDGDLMDINEHHKRYLEGGLFEKYTADKYPVLVEYAKENGLSFKNKEHIIVLLNEFERLSIN